MFYLLAGYTYSQPKDAEVIDFHSSFKVVEESLQESTRIGIAIHNNSGTSLSLFSFHENVDNKIVKLNAWIEDLSGNRIKNLENKDISISQVCPNPLMYQDDKSRTFNLQHSEYPYVIRIEIERQIDEFSYITDWTPVFHPEHSTINATLRIEVPNAYNLKVTEHAIKALQNSSNNNTKTYYWESAYIANKQDPVHTPSHKVNNPRVMAAPTTFVYGVKGSQATWKDYGNWYKDLTKDLLDLPESEKIKIEKLIIDQPDRLGIVRALYNYVQENIKIYHTPFELGKIKPLAASFVAINGIADNKSAINYLKALIDYVGIESYVAHVNKGERSVPIKFEHPSQQFNHSMLVIPMANDSLWLDFKKQKLPFGYLSLATQNKQALIFDYSNSTFRTTPGLNIENSTVISTYNVNLEASGNVTVDINKTLKGKAFERINYIYHNYDKEGQKFFFSRYLKFPRHKLLDWEISELPDSTQLALKLTIQSNELFKKYGNDGILYVFRTELPEFNLTSKNQNQEIWIDAPYAYQEKVVINIPRELTFSKKVMDADIHNKFGSFKVKIMHNAGQIIVEKEVLLRRGRYKNEDRGSFLSFIREIHQYEKNNVILFN